MGLLINQGRQDTSKDNMVIVAKGVQGVIESIRLSERFSGAIDIRIRILAGPYANRVVFDSVTYDPNSEFSWKYRALRKAVGKPYSPQENPQIDIEAILLNQAIMMDLSERNGFQQVKYLERKAQPQQGVRTPMTRPQAQTYVPPVQNQNDADWGQPVYGDEDFSHLGINLNDPNGTPEWQ